MYHLAPHLNKTDWTPEEDRRIIEAVEQDGTAWAKLVQYFPGRTDNGIKNRWNTLIRKRLRRELRHSEAQQHAAANAAGLELSRQAGDSSDAAADATGVEGSAADGALAPAPPSRRPGVPTTAEAAIAQQRVVVQRASSSSASVANAMRRQERARHELDMRAAEAARAAAAAAEAAAAAYLQRAPSVATKLVQPPDVGNRCPCGRARLNIGNAWICTQHGDGSCFSRKRPLPGYMEDADEGEGAFPSTMAAQPMAQASSADAAATTVTSGADGALALASSLGGAPLAGPAEPAHVLETVAVGAAAVAAEGGGGADVPNVTLVMSRGGSGTA